MVTYVFRSMSHFVLNYVDDFLGVEYRQNVYRAHTTFKNLLRDIGLQRSHKKSVELTQCLEFIGNLVDSKNFTIGFNRCQKRGTG